MVFEWSDVRICSFDLIILIDRKNSNYASEKRAPIIKVINEEIKQISPRVEC
jgi:hypothetical protein